MVNDAAAAQLWPGQNPLGRRIRLGRSGRTQWITVVGVSESTPGSPLARTQGPPPVVYLPLAQHPHSMPASMPFSLQLRTNGEVPGLARDLLGAVSAVDPGLMLESVATAEEANAAWARPMRATALLFLGLAGVAVALAMIGVYGVSAFAAIRRTREIGIRMALGATMRDAVRLILAEAARTALIGVVIGIALALALTRLMRSLLFNVSPTDPIVFTGVALLLAALAILASYWPARRVMRVDPAITLRHE
jgi:ABC-type antimicrobial peptide transport system permease subunit